MLIKNEIKNMTERSQEVFRCLVETYLETGEPVGSSTLARTLKTKVSSATVRHVMQDLEVLGLLGSPHISSGRVPTQIGLRLFVDGLLEVSDMPGETRAEIDNSVIDDSVHFKDRSPYKAH